MAVKIVLGNIYSKIVGHLPDEIQEELDDILSYKHPDARFIPRVQKKLWDGVFRLYYRKKGQQFYTGLLAFVRDVLKKHNVSYTIQDGRVNPGKNYPELKFSPPSGYEERDYQTFTIDRSEQFTRGVLSVATGGGKTMMVTRLIGQLQTYPFIFFVLTKDLMDQAHDTLSRCLNVPIGMIGDGKADFQKITVCTIQTAIRALNAENSKFKLKDYKFDEEDKWDEKGIESAEKAAKIRKLIEICNGVYFDECVSGDTLVLTEKGEVRIDKINEKKCRFVQTYDGYNIIYKPILNYWDKGERETLRIKLDNGQVLTCTKEHKVYTTRGWIEAESLMVTDRLLIATADVEQNCHTINTNPDNMSWDTKVASVEKGEKQNVYDIEVEDTHCFFGNGILVHNCHHTAAQTAKEVLTAATNAYWRFGGSATPYRESGDEIMIQAMFGSKIVDINASYLIQEGHLIHPYIFFDPIDSEADYHSYAKIYKNCIVENEEFNRHVADTANHLVSRNLSTLVLVQHYKQGDMLKAMIPGSEFVTGRMSSKNRRESIQALRDRQSLCMIATSLADEGLDIPTLDAALLAGGGASATRINQRIGRTLRQDKKDPKEKSIVVVYDHYKTRFLKEHTKKVRRILKKESEFTVLESKGGEFIKDEIDDVLGIEHASTDIFDL